MIEQHYSNTEKKVCAYHIDDAAIRTFIQTTGQKATCHYCGKRGTPTVEVQDLGDFIGSGLGFLYDDAANWLPYESAEGGYLGDTFETRELLESHVPFDPWTEELITDLEDTLGDHVWCRDDPFGETESEDLEWDWKEFRRFVQHTARYTFFFQQREKHLDFKVNVADILSEVGARIHKYNLLRLLPAGTTFYRCRQHKLGDAVTGMADIGTPKVEYVLYPNRMSPAGIPMFYGAFHQEVAELETLDRGDTGRPLYALGTFTSKKELLVVDFTVLPAVSSIFDEQSREHYHSLVFLHAFVRDLSQPVSRNGGEHVEYVPTQVVTEYIRFLFAEHYTRKVQGIIYPSSKKKGAAACVLFLDHEQCGEQLKLTGFTRHNIAIAPAGAPTT